jgi:hypothetical protein
MYFAAKYFIEFRKLTVTGMLPRSHDYGLYSPHRPLTRGILLKHNSY